MGVGVVQNRESPDFRSPEVGRYEYPYIAEQVFVCHHNCLEIIGSGF